jgi:hypothetical protein
VRDWIGRKGADILDACGTSGLREKFAAAGISLGGESEVKLTVCIVVAPEGQVLGVFSRSRIEREVATIRIGNGRHGRTCFRVMDIRKSTGQ